MSEVATKVTVRDFKPEDEQAVMNLYEATAELHRNAVLDFLDNDERLMALTAKHKVFLVAVNENGTVVGFAYVKIKHRTLHEEKARLLHLVVDSAERNKGVADSLLDECDRRLLEHGITLTYSCVNVKNNPMVEFLRKRGYVLREAYYRFEKGLRLSDRPDLYPPVAGWESDDV